MFPNVQRPLPKPLERLAELAFDLRLIGSKTMLQIWRRLGAEAWSRCNNPYMILQNADQKTLDEAAGAHPAVCVTVERSGPIPARSTDSCTAGACPPVALPSTTRRGSCPATPRHSCPPRPRTSRGEVEGESAACFG